jgi:hypothetical protein
VGVPAVQAFQVVRATVSATSAPPPLRTTNTELKMAEVTNQHLFPGLGLRSRRTETMSRTVPSNTTAITMARLLQTSHRVNPELIESVGPTRLGSHEHAHSPSW